MGEEGRSVYTVGRVQLEGVVLPVEVLILGAVHTSQYRDPLTVIPKIGVADPSRNSPHFWKM